MYSNPIHTAFVDFCWWFEKGWALSVLKSCQIHHREFLVNQNFLKPTDLLPYLSLMFSPHPCSLQLDNLSWHFLPFLLFLCSFRYFSPTPFLPPSPLSGWLSSCVIPKQHLRAGPVWVLGYVVRDPSPSSHPWTLTSVSLFYPPLC